MTALLAMVLPKATALLQLETLSERPSSRDGPHSLGALPFHHFSSLDPSARPEYWTEADDEGLNQPATDTSPIQNHR